MRSRRTVLSALVLATWMAAPALLESAEPVATGGEGSVPAPAKASVDIGEMIGPPRGEPLAGEKLIEVLDEITGLMRCPVCQGLSVRDSPVASALAIREEVRSLLGAGYTPDQIFDYFEGAYGEFIRLSPRARGFNLVVWIAPLVMVALGVWLVWARTRRRADGDRDAIGEADLAPYRTRVRQEVGY